MERQRLFMAVGAVLWILGIILSVIGLNIHTQTGTWMTVIGSASFLAGLFFEGVVWFDKRKKEK